MAPHPDDSAVFDSARGLLLIGQERFEQVVAAVGGGDDAFDWSADHWRVGGIAIDGRLDPTVAAMAQVAAAPARLVTIERVAAGRAAPLVVAWDRGGRVTLSEPMTDGRVAVRLSSFDLLPSLLLHELRLFRWHAEDVDEVRPTITTSTTAIEALLGAGPDDATPVPEAVTDLGVQLAWRAVGQWAGQAPDRAIIGLVAGDGPYRLDRDQEADETVRLVPTTVGALADALGLIATGKGSAPQGSTGAAGSSGTR